MTVPNLAPHDGTTIPQLGFGVFQVPPADTAATVTEALEVGYRHLDTAQMYGNEAEVGEAIKGMPRDELYVTTKLSNASHRPDDARRSIDESLLRLGLDRVDLFLMHWPLPTRYDGDYVTTWETMADFVEDGRATSIGVSNFQPDHLERIVTATGVVPVVNQVEVHPWFGNELVRSANEARAVRTEAWAPIAQGAIHQEPVVNAIADRLGRTTAQVTLRWHLQRGDIVFPKTVSRARMEENFAVFDFELSPDEMAAITGLDRGEEGRLGPHPDVFDMIPD
ncbi:MAG: aldo/keto reductase [Nocardioides sp.]